jgi:hypothetical protein
VTARSTARQELEQHLRSIVPTAPLRFDTADPKATAAAAGASGLALGFVWGFLRGRRRYRR